MSVPSTNPSLTAVRNDLDRSGNFSIRNARGMDRLQKFSGNISLSEYAGTCNSILRVSPAIDTYDGYTGNRNTPSYHKYGFPSSSLCQPQGNGWRVQARGNSNPNDQWVEARFYGRVNENGTYRFRYAWNTVNAGAVRRFGQISVISFANNYGSGASTTNYHNTNIMAAGAFNENTTFSLSTGRPFVMIYIYAIIKGGEGSNTYTADITNCSLKRA